MSTRHCPVCGTTLDARRRHARYCGGACRAEASRLRRLLVGQEVDGFASLADRRARRRKRTEGVDAGRVAA